MVHGPFSWRVVLGTAAMRGIRGRRLNSVVVWLGDGNGSDPHLLGGKAAALGRLARRFRVPPGFCIPAPALTWLSQGRPPPSGFWQAIRAAYIELAERCGQPEPAVAVRSSGVEEDSTTASFAGQHMTYLNVKGTEALARTIERCAASARSQRAATYRQQRGLPVEEPAIAVLVQQMVLAEAAFVAFSTNPASGSSEEVVINANFGLGESIVAGTVTPDTFVVGRTDLSIVRREVAEKVRMTSAVPGGTKEVSVPRKMRSRPALDDRQVLAVIKLVLNLEEIMGYPVDVEGAWAGGELFLLQCRPITTGFPVMWEEERDTELTWEWDEEHCPRPLAPLSADYMRLGAVAGWSARFEDDGVPLRTPARVFNGYLYYGFRWLVPEDLIPGAREQLVGVNRRRARSLKAYWNGTVLPALFESYEWMLSAPVESAPLSELGGLWEELWKRILKAWKMHFQSSSPAYQSLRDVDEVYRSIFPEAGFVEALELVQASSETLQKVQGDLYRLAQVALSHPAVADVLEVDPDQALSLLPGVEGGRDFLQAFRSFLDEHGHLGHAYDDLRLASWGEEPRLALVEVRRHMMSAVDPEKTWEKLEPDARSLLEDARAKLAGRVEELRRLEDALSVAREAGPFTEEHNYWVDRMLHTRVRQFVLRVGQRLAGASVIADPEDIFFLYVDEVSMVLRSPTDLRVDVARRRSELGRWERLTPPRHLGKQPVEDAPSTAVEADDSGTLMGEAASAGLVRGATRVVLSAENLDRVQPGDILVCRSSNMSWVPLFRIIAGLVAEVGGVLSHAAIIAREFGVPAVVGVRGATKRLRDGQTVEVDGTLGRVRIPS